MSRDSHQNNGFAEPYQNSHEDHYFDAVISDAGDDSNNGLLQSLGGDALDLPSPPPNEDTQRQWRYDGDFKDTILARDGIKATFLHDIKFVDAQGSGRNRFEAFSRFSDFLVPILQALSHVIDLNSEDSADSGDSASFVENLINTAPINEIPEVSPQLFQLIFNVVFRHVDGARSTIICKILEEPKLPEKMEKDATETWSKMVVNHLRELYKKSPHEAKERRAKYLHCANFDFSSLDSLAGSLNRVDYMIFKHFRKLLYFFGEVLSLPIQSNEERREALNLFMRVFVIKHQYSIEYTKIAEILEMRMSIKYHKALLDLFARWCAAILYEYKNTGTEKEQQEKLLDIKNKPRGSNAKTPQNQQSGRDMGKKRKSNNGSGSSRDYQSFKQTRRSAVLQVCDVLFLTAMAHGLLVIITFIWEKITWFSSTGLKVLWTTPNTPSQELPTSTPFNQRVQQDKLEEGEGIVESWSSQDEVAILLEPAVYSKKPICKVHLGVSISFLRLFARFIEQQASYKFENLNEYQLVGAISATENDEEEEAMPEWSIWKLGKPKQGDSDSQSLIDLLRSDEGRDLQAKLLAVAETKEERDPETWFGPATDYVCYAWKMKFKDLVDALVHPNEESRKSQSRTSESKYLWLDLFAVPQYRRNREESTVIRSLGDEYRALRQTIVQIIETTQDNIIVVMDSFGDSNKVLTRRWCWFEIALALEAKKSLSMAMPKYVMDDLQKRVMNWSDEYATMLHDLSNLIKGISFQRSECSKDADSKFIENEINCLSVGTKIDSKVRAAMMQLVLLPFQTCIAMHKSSNLTSERLLSYFEDCLDLSTLARVTSILAPSFTIKGANKDGIRLMDATSKKIRERLEPGRSESQAIGLTADAEERQSLQRILSDILSAKGRMLGDTFEDPFIDEAIESFQESIRIREQINDSKLYVTHYYLGRALINMHMNIFGVKWTKREREGDITIAEKHLRKSVELQESLATPPAELGATYVHLAKALDLRGAPLQQSEDLFQRALKIQSSEYGPGDQRYFLTTKCYGMSLAFHREYDRAINVWYSCFHQIQLATMQSSVPEYHLTTLLRWFAIGFTQLERNKAPNIAEKMESFSTDYAQPALLELAMKRKDIFMDASKGARLAALEVTHWIHSVTPRALILRHTDTEATRELLSLLASVGIEAFTATTTEETDQHFQQYIFAFVFVMENHFPLQESKMGAFFETIGMCRERDEPRTVFLHFTSELSSSETREESLTQTLFTPHQLVEKSLKAKDFHDEIRDYRNRHDDRFRFWDRFHVEGDTA